MNSIITVGHGVIYRWKKAIIMLHLDLSSNIDLCRIEIVALSKNSIKNF